MSRSARLSHTAGSPSFTAPAPRVTRRPALRRDPTRALSLWCPRPEILTRSGTRFPAFSFFTRPHRSCGLSQHARPSLCALWAQFCPAPARRQSLKTTQGSSSLSHCTGGQVSGPCPLLPFRSQHPWARSLIQSLRPPHWGTAVTPPAPPHTSLPPPSIPSKHAWAWPESTTKLGLALELRTTPNVSLRTWELL